MQINFINSPIGQLALGDVNHVDLSTTLIAAERQLDVIDAPAEDKTRVRQVLHQMGATGATLLTGASGELLAALARKLIGLS